MEIGSPVGRPCQGTGGRDVIFGSAPDWTSLYTTDGPFLYDWFEGDYRITFRYVDEIRSARFRSGDPDGMVSQSYGCKTDAKGSFSFQTTLKRGLDTSRTVFVQVWLSDPQQACSLSNASLFSVTLTCCWIFALRR